jgi:hypothetical protein
MDRMRERQAFKASQREWIDVRLFHPSECVQPAGQKHRFQVWETEEFDIPMFKLWLKQNIGGGFTVHHCWTGALSLAFEHLDDAVLFRLKYL